MILAINTKSERVSIALYKKNEIEAETSWESYHTQSRELLPAIDLLIKKHHFSLNDLTAITVFQGPGSFTGLRVGISIANALSWSLNIPIIAIKNSKNEPDKDFSALIIAKKAYLKINQKKFISSGKIVEPYYKNKDFLSHKN